MTTFAARFGLMSAVAGNRAGGGKRKGHDMKTETIKAVAAALALAAFGTATADVSCRVEPDYSVRLADKAGDAYVKVTLAADRVVAANRPSVNLAIVLDRSGSEAIRRLDAKDIVSVVVYDNKSEVIIPAQHVTEKEALIARISAIEPRGCTALFDGVSAGATELRKFKGKCEISRVLLVSDGQANVGPSSPDELGRYGALLMKDGIAVSTIGLGVDYNEDLMTRLSQKSDGNSYFVENSNDLPRVFARELGDVLSVAATKVALKVRFCGGFVPVALIGRDGRIMDGVVTIDLNQLYGGQDSAAVAASVNKGVVRERALNENAMRTEEALRRADRGDYAAARELIMMNHANSVQVQGAIGVDAKLQADAEMQMSNSMKMSRGSYDSGARKKMKTSSFQLFNQQKLK